MHIVPTSRWSRLRGLSRGASRRARVREALRVRWAELPLHVRTPEQVLGRIGVGCEGTHGVFPRCNLTCSPCYHSADANQVRVDGDHTLAEVRRQLDLLAERRGPRAHAQLIGGEVSLLDPEDHAAALLAMRAAGREPMSMSHGDFDLAHLEALVRGPDGRVRLPRVSFAGHFDSLMRGRRGLVRPRSEAELHPFRREFVERFAELRRRTGVRAYLAHNMTVTRGNLAEVAEVVREVRTMGFALMSFQPAARIGDERRWPRDGAAGARAGARAGAGAAGVGMDELWAEIESGMGQRLAWQPLQVGDPRCNRTAFGLLVGDRWIPAVDPDSAGDLAARDLCLGRYGGYGLDASQRGLLVVRVAATLTRHPGHALVVLAWVGRAVRRSGGLGHALACLARGRVRPLTLVVHAFMDAADVRPAWELMGRGVVAEDPRVRATQERLAACSYHMAHPETGELVPACAQHAVLDPAENARLRTLLPLPTLRPGATAART